LNLRYFSKKKSHVKAGKNGPKVSVLIPARNEEGFIGSCLNSLKKQNYSNFEVLVLDDDSTDGTYEIAHEIVSIAANFQLFHNNHLPSGWCGKSHALHLLEKEASGEIIFLTDANTIHEPDSIGFAVAALETFQLDVISMIPRIEMVSIMDAFYNMWIMSSSLVLPLFLSDTACSHGKYICLKRSSLRKIGGFASVWNSPHEDSSLTKLMNENGMKMIYLDGTHLYSYRRNGSFLKAMSRNFFSAMNGNLLGACFCAMLQLSNAFSIFYCVTTGRSSGYLPQLIVSSAFLRFAIVAFHCNSLPYLIPSLPIHSILSVIIITKSVFTHYFHGRTDWKGRNVKV